MSVATPQIHLEAPAVVTQPKPKKSRWKTVGAIVLWQLLALGFVEGVMYSAGLGEEEIFRLDKQIGFTHIPNKRIYWKQEGPGVYSYFNADGMREPNLTIQKPAGTYRIAVLGDSLVEGLQSPIEQTFGYVLGKDLTDKMHRNVQVLNFGNSGYSTAQEYLQLNKIWKYQPDMVLLGYSNRDIFENWSPPDETITNVRPYALHLPKGHLVVDNSSVTGWMRTPRAKFLLAITPIREYSHIYGMISAAETQFGHTDPTYRAFCEFLTNPVKSIKTAWAGLPGFVASIPGTVVRSLTTFAPESAHHRQKKLSPNNIAQQLEAAKLTKEQSAAMERGETSTATTSSETATSAQKPIETSNETSKNDDATLSSIKKAPDTVPNHPETKGIAEKQRGIFLDLLTRTLGSLFGEMRSECTKHNAKFCVIAMPSKSALCPDPNQGPDTFALSYPEEVDLVKKLCADNSVPVYDAEAPMTKVPTIVRSANFYASHLTPKGHAFVERGLEPFVEKQIQGDSKP